MQQGLPAVLRLMPWQHAQAAAALPAASPSMPPGTGTGEANATSSAQLADSLSRLSWECTAAGVVVGGGAGGEALGRCSAQGLT